MNFKRKYRYLGSDFTGNKLNDPNVLNPPKPMKNHYVRLLHLRFTSFAWLLLIKCENFANF